MGATEIRRVQRGLASVPAAAPGWGGGKVRRVAHGIVEELGRIAMSQNLAASLARASGYAQAQLHREVWLEHLLLALTEDPDAAQVLLASHVDIARLNTEVSEVLGRIEDRNPPERSDAISVSPDLKRILEAAGAAASKGRRREINGAIVLAAIVGDGRTASAHLLRAQGLTFEEAIRVLRAAPQPAAPAALPAPAPAQHVPQPPLPHQVPPQSAPELAQSPSRSRTSTEDILASARERVQRARSEAAAAASAQAAAAAQHQPPVQEYQPPQYSAPPEPEAYQPPLYEPGPQPAVEPARDYQQPYYEASQPAAAPEPQDHGMPPPLPMGGEEPGYSPYGAGPGAAAEQGWSGEQGWQQPESPPAQPEWGPPPALPSPGIETAAQVPWGSPPAPPSYAPPPAYEVPGIERAAQPGSGYGGSIPGASPAPSYREPQLPPHPIYPQWPEPQQLPQPPPAQPPAPQHAPPQQPQMPDYGAYEPPPQPPPMAIPTPAPRASAPARAQRERRAAGSGIEAGQLAENIPRLMRKLTPVVVEARIAKADVKELMADMSGGGPAYRHDLAVTKAMSVRLRAPEGGFFIETASPETQWIENTLGLMSADFASWRWTVTPRETGKRRLQLVVAARTVGSDGLAAETALPERVIEVAVKTNYALAARHWGGWIAAAIMGGVLSKFGQSLLDASTKLATLLKAG